MIKITQDSGEQLIWLEGDRKIRWRATWVIKVLDKYSSSMFGG